MNQLPRITDSFRGTQAPRFHLDIARILAPGRSMIRRSAVVLFALMLTCGLAAQTKNELEKKRAALDKQIKTTTALIEQAKKEQRVTQEQLQLLESQIQSREQLINAMGGELRVVDQLLFLVIELFC